MGLEALSQRLLLQSLPALGVVDVGAESEAASDEGLAPPWISPPGEVAQP